MSNISSEHAGDLILFAKLIEAGSFSLAAKRLGIPKSTLSRRVAALEGHLGQRLVTRTTRRLVITDFGQRVMEHGRKLAQELQAVSDLVQLEQDYPRGVLRVSMPPEIVQLDLTSVLMRYSKRYPEVRVELDMSTRWVDLLADRFDVVVRIARQLPDDSTLVARRLGEIALHMYASPEYLRQHGTPLDPGDLAWHICSNYINSSGEVVPWRLSKGAETVVVVPNSPLASNSPQLLRELCLKGAGIVVLADNQASEALEKGQLVQVLPQWSLTPVTIWCVTPGRKLLPARTRAFVQMLIKEMGKTVLR